MKNLKYLVIACILALFASILLVSCEEDSPQIGEFITPTNLQVVTEIVGQDADNPFGDGSGIVNFNVSADNAISYQLEYTDGTPVDAASSQEFTHGFFAAVGVNTYNVAITAFGTGGLSTTIVETIEVLNSFDDIEAKNLLSGGAGNSKTWYLAAEEIGHLGVGPSIELDLEIYGQPNSFYFPEFFATQPFEKCNDDISSCLCNDELTFTLDASNQLTFELNNNGQTFFNASHQDIVGGSLGEDACFDFDSSGIKNVSLAPTTIDWSLIPDPDFPQPRGTVMNLSNDGFLGYYVSSSSYEIMELTSSSLTVRTIDGLNPDLAWYHKYTTIPPGGGFESIYNNLIWSDEFDVNGAPDPANWTYDLGAGGWGNNELQTYTNNAENVIVEDGSLKITAIATGGNNYTSARVKSENLFEFNYGRVEVRAKLPTGGGTWPAIWSLGANFDTVGWPTCGEIDIMEHVGNNNRMDSNSYSVFSG